MVEIITSTMICRGRTEHEYKGTVRLEDVTQKKTIIDLLDSNNFGGTVDLCKANKPNMYTFIVHVFID